VTDLLVRARGPWIRLRARHSFLAFLIRRLFALLWLGVGISLISFTLTQLVPADPALANLGQQAGAEPAVVKAFDHRYGLDKPLPIQFAIYLGRLLHGDLGISEQTERPVVTDLSSYIPATAELAICAMLLAIIVGVSLGMVAARYRNTWVDQLVRVVTLGGVSIPIFFLALVVLYVFYLKFAFAPGVGRLDPTLTPPPQVTGLYTVDALLAGQWSVFQNAVQHLVLPALVLAVPVTSLLTRFTRASVLEVVDNDYVRAARAKGLPPRTVLIRHVLRAASPGIITVAGLALANVLTGTVLVEKIFSWPGIGQYAYNSAMNLDLPSIMGVTLFVAIIYTLTNLVVDILYSVIDPRIRLV
jgi:peptide/nickel transport system permease protein